MISKQEMEGDVTLEWLSGALGLAEDSHPFPWQARLIQSFQRGEIPTSLDIPTGLGKTGVMAVWLVARAFGAPVPRRLIYVVDRRAVVDQATDTALKLRSFVDSRAEIKAKLGLDQRSLPISTLRGQFVDNREWLDDPSLAAIIVGTIDMIGSRMLFEGFGVSRKMRPYHAALIGIDALVVLDEAHLVPPFQRLLETAANGKPTFGPGEDALRGMVPSFKLLAMSATGLPNQDQANAFGMTDSDLKDAVVGRRLNAAKVLSVRELQGEENLAEKLAEEAWALSRKEPRAAKIVVYCDKRKDAEKVAQAINERSDVDEGDDVSLQLLVGARRVYERQGAAKWLDDQGFTANSAGGPQRPAFLIATSAGEVGVDLDADHMVSDLVAWERMIQRLGRVNRRGNGSAEVVILADLRQPMEASDVAERVFARQKAARALIDSLPKRKGGRDGSPSALRNLKLKAETDPELKELLKDATTGPPLRPALTRPLVDAFSMTSFEEHTGRPEIQPWLRGWIEDDQPQTVVVWRQHLPVRKSDEGRPEARKRDSERFFEAAPPHLSEILETNTFEVIDWLTKRAKRLEPGQIIGDSAGSPKNGDGAAPSFHEDDIVAIALARSGDFRRTLTLSDVLSPEKADLEKALGEATLIVDAGFAGLDNGLLDPKSDKPLATADCDPSWMEEGRVLPPTVPFRIKVMETEQPTADDEEWYERERFPTEFAEDGEPSRWLVVQKWRHDAATEDDRAISRLQLLEEHEQWAESKARALGQRLGLPAEYAEMLAVAARLHDEGKGTRRWQRAFNAPAGGVYAKTPKPAANFIRVLGRYRHEFGSLLVAEKHERIRSLPDDLRDLALHLIVAHHGFARPFITTEGVEDSPPSVLESKASEVALRFARMEKRWGPWGVAWWETLLRAADQQASRTNEEARRNQSTEAADG